MNDTPLWLLFSLLGCLLLISAFFSGSETAMMSLNRYRLKHLRKKNRGARRAYKLLKRPDRLIGIILIGNNLVNITASAIATVIGIRLYGDAGIFAATVILTLSVLVFSEVTPKTIAALYPERFAFPASHVLRPLLTLFYPAVWLVNKFSNGLMRLFGINPNKDSDDSLSKEELRTVVDESGSKMSGNHQDMLINILDLETVTVNDIMVPRNEIEGLNLEDSTDKLLDQIINSEYTRLPVYEGDINNIVGLLHMKKVSRMLRGGADALTREAIKRFSREPYFVPESTPLNTQLLHFQKERRRIGIVVDEYGEVDGLVTLEDILEEIVGDFTTNQAETDDEIVRQEDGSILIEGSATIRDINKATEWELPTNGPKTINGLALERLEHIPDGNVSFTVGNYRFETISITNKMIDRLKATRVVIAKPYMVGDDELDDEDDNE